MTTKRRPFNTRNTANNVTAQRRSAENRRCKACNRKGALVRVEQDNGAVTYCRWDDCKYERVFSIDTMVFTETGLPDA